MATKDKMTAAEVQQVVQNNGTNPNGYQAVSPLGNTASTSDAWRTVKQTGNAVTDYKGILKAQPGAYNSAYQTPLNQTMNNLLNQRQFNYDVNTDALYQQIKDNFIKQGRQAMMDTQGQSAALTGGYGNSYGVLAGQQAYQESLGNLSQQIPELYQLAYNRYLNNENSQRQNLAALQGLDESAYQRYQYDTQQYEQKLADAYAKYKAATASRGGGGRKLTYAQYKQYVSDATAWADATGGDVSDYFDQAVNAGVIDKTTAGYIKNAAGTYQKGKDKAKAEADAAAAQAGRDDAANDLKNRAGIT